MEERIQKIMANKGLCSRREAEQWIADGRVKVDGMPATVGQKVDLSVQDIVVNGRSLRGLNPPRYVIAVNKPRGYVCSNEDEYAEKLIFDLLPKSFQRVKLFVAGRLDKDSSGLVILTNDGELAQRMTHPSNQIEKRYRVRFKPPMERQEFKWFLEGQRLDGEWLKLDRILVPYELKEGPFGELEVLLAHGKKREIRRLFEASGRLVQRLVRLSIGRFQVKGIAPGGHRVLKEREIESLLATTDPIA
jgi:23S rRNA pseudouridine2605 synthase